MPRVRKRRPLRKTSSCRVQSGGAGGARAAGGVENRLGGSWMEARATLFLMWKADRDTLGLPVVQRKRSCWSARGSVSGDGLWPGPACRVPGMPASRLWKAVQVRPT